MVDEGVWHTCVHEAVHALTAHLHGWHVLQLRCDAARDGVCNLIVPFRPLEMPEKFRAKPLQTRKALVEIISVLAAPSIVLDVEHSAGDQGDLWVWRYVWDKCRYASYHGSPWEVIYGEAEDAVYTWLQRPGTAECLERVAQELSRRRFLSAEAFRGLVSPPAPPAPPAPQRPPTPPRRTPAPAPMATQTAAPRGAAPQPQERQPLPLPWETLVWAYYQYFGRSRGVAPLSPSIPRPMRGFGRLLMS
jgi:hypothetical protein